MSSGRLCHMNVSAFGDLAGNVPVTIAVVLGLVVALI